MGNNGWKEEWMGWVMKEVVLIVLRRKGKKGRGRNECGFDRMERGGEIWSEKRSKGLIGNNKAKDKKEVGMRWVFIWLDGEKGCQWSLKLVARGTMSYTQISKAERQGGRGG